MFFTCLIGLFTGTRINAAATLQYNNIINKDGIDCIEIIENHPIKNLKTEDSERVVPIHSQLLEVGFVDYIKRKQKKLKATDTDFIFPRCITSGNVYYEKYPRIFFNFLKDIGIKADKGRDGYDFHSFRKNISTAMQDAKIVNSYINDVVGWKGNGTMEQHYSNHTLPQIKTELEKFGYDFLAPHFAKWKAIMAKK
jgi:integrase